jgi:hypothetical protein
MTTKTSQATCLFVRLNYFSSFTLYMMVVVVVIATTLNRTKPAHRFISTSSYPSVPQGQARLLGFMRNNFT